MRRELLRTCKRCGTSWYVLKRMRNKRPEGRFQAFASRQIAQSTGTDASYELRQAQFRSLVTCPSCASVSFKDSAAPRNSR